VQIAFAFARNDCQLHSPAHLRHDTGQFARLQSRHRPLTTALLQNARKTVYSAETNKKLTSTYPDSGRRDQQRLLAPDAILKPDLLESAPFRP
ncbi:hypothetical protein DOI34_24665, partial [Salmonella enterica subsp. enterica serovar Virchow]|nr:hypothetical protein [Salmonella enterica subsp. enterica serovar Virchow]